MSAALLLPQRRADDRERKDQCCARGAATGAVTGPHDAHPALLAGRSDWRPDRCFDASCVRLGANDAAVRLDGEPLSTTLACGLVSIRNIRVPGHRFDQRKTLDWKNFAKTTCGATLCGSRTLLPRVSRAAASPAALSGLFSINRPSCTVLAGAHPRSSGPWQRLQHSFAARLLTCMGRRPRHPLEDRQNSFTPWCWERSACFSTLLHRRKAGRPKVLRSTE